METAKKSSLLSTRYMVRISLLGLLGFILLNFNLPLPIFPSFIKLDIANLPSIVASLSMGPMAGVGVELIKNLLKGLLASKTIGIGEISNFICGSSLVVPLGFICSKMPNAKGYVLGAIAGVTTLCIAASLSNYFFIIPAYAAAFGGIEPIIAMASKINSSITDLKALIMFSIIPFNILKGLLNVVLGYALFKVARPIFASVK